MRRGQIVLVVALMLGVVVSDGATPSKAAGCWARVSMPDITGIVEGADFASTHYGWAVGSRLTSRGVGPISLRWSGTTWRAIPAPHPDRTTYLYDVAVVSTKQAWAVGSAGGEALIIRWNGSAWRKVLAPTPGSRSGLAAIARDPRFGSLLAVGSWVKDGEAHPLILRWTGSRWRTALLRVGLHDVRLTDVVIAPGVTWVVGDYGSYRHHQPLILRRALHGWKRVAVPSSSDSRWLSAVAASGPNDALAVGNRWEHALVLHWNGAAWRPVPSSRVPGLRRAHESHDVAMLPSGEAWITASRSIKVGSTDPDYGYHPQAIFHRRDGTWTWEVPPRVPYALLLDITPLSASASWALGGVALEDGGYPLAFRC